MFRTSEPSSFGCFLISSARLPVCWSHFLRLFVPPFFSSDSGIDFSEFFPIFLIFVRFNFQNATYLNLHWWGRSGRGGFSQPASQPNRRKQPASQPAKAAESASQPHNAAESASQPDSQRGGISQPASQPRRRNQRASQGSGTIRANMAMACIDMDVGRCE